MIRRVISIWLSLAMMFGFVVIVDVTIDFTPPVEGITLYVNTTGSGGAYTKIQNAIDNASDGYTVFVYSGIYHEHVIVNKTINLTGENKDTTIIDGGGSGDVVTIITDWVNISGFNITGGGTGPWDAGLELNYVSQCEINDNIFTLNNYIGILLYYSDKNNIIDNSASSNVFYGIRFYYSNWNNIIGNTLSYNKLGMGITHSDHNNIINNTADSNDSQGFQLYLSNWNNVTGNRASNNPDYYGIYISQSVDNNITDNTVFSNDVGIEVSQSPRTNIIDNTIYDNVHNGISLGSSPKSKVINNTISDNMWGINCGGSNKTLIRDNIVSISSWYGISLTFSSYCNLTNNTMMDDGIYFRGNYIDNWNTHNIDESNTQNGKPVYYLKNQTGGVVPSGKGQYILANCSDVRVENLTFIGNCLPIQLGFCSHVNITNNTFSSIKYYSLYLEYSNENNILANFASNNNRQIFRIYYSDKNYISGNSFSSNKDMCIDISHSKDNIVFENTATQNIQGGFIRLWYSDYNKLIQNLGYDSGGGITLDYSDYNEITGNKFLNGGGIDLDYSHRNMVTYNTVSNTGTAISLYWSSNNNIYHNNIIDNNDQAFDSQGTGNKWDNDYPSGGNYWSDYTGGDLNSSPNQDVPPPDGIGDTAYVIDSNSQDNYPLMQPIENYTILNQGWNLISLPLIQEDQNLIKVLEMIDGYYDTVGWYNISDTSDPWKVYNVNKLFGIDLNKINETMGFWIYITPAGGAVLLHNGTQLTENQTITLHLGWNMVGYPSLTNYNRTQGLNNLTFGTHVDSIWTFDAATQKWETVGPIDYFKPGRGYWINANVECTWEVPL